MEHAQSPPMDIRGRWVAVSDGIITGNPQHHPPSAKSGPRTDHVEITITIGGQDGRRFWGLISSELGEEELIGVIGFDGRSVVARDTDGLYQGTILDRDTMDIIYSHANSQSAVVAAHRFERQK